MHILFSFREEIKKNELGDGEQLKNVQEPEESVRQVRKWHLANVKHVDRRRKRRQKVVLGEQTPSRKQCKI